MRTLRSRLWRLFFILSALFLVAGGPRHPGGTMAEMLAHPDWVPSHALMLAGFVSLLVGLILYQRSVVLPDRTRMWARYAVLGTALQVVEMAFHTAASIDQLNLVAGRATPVLTTHLWLSVVLYPIFGLTLVGLIVAGARDRAGIGVDRLAGDPGCTGTCVGTSACGPVWGRTGEDPLSAVGSFCTLDVAGGALAYTRRACAGGFLSDWYGGRSHCEDAKQPKQSRRLLKGPAGLLRGVAPRNAPDRYRLDLAPPRD